MYTHLFHTHNVNNGNLYSTFPYLRLSVLDNRKTNTDNMHIMHRSKNVTKQNDSLTAINTTTKELSNKASQGSSQKKRMADSASDKDN